VPGRPASFQTKAPLSVGYKAVLVHEFARPPKFALRWKFKVNSQPFFVPRDLKLYPLIPNLVETLFFGLFILCFGLVTPLSPLSCHVTLFLYARNCDLNPSVVMWLCFLMLGTLGLKLPLIYFQRELLFSSLLGTMTRDFSLHPFWRRARFLFDWN